jgi:hypothetical protein
MVLTIPTKIERGMVLTIPTKKERGMVLTIPTKRERGMDLTVSPLFAVIPAQAGIHPAPRHFRHRLKPNARLRRNDTLGPFREDYPA